ncbi:hypothetical protein BGX38DRAFT_1142797 [Terfezia claveryi]|nr:hypothetical protein BGX38DRAFT_1142797 [Terfezia claveryi]
MRPTLHLASYIGPFSPTAPRARRPTAIPHRNLQHDPHPAQLPPSHSVYRTSTTTPHNAPPRHRHIHHPPGLRKLAEDADWSETSLQAAIAAAQVKAQFRDLTAAIPENAEDVNLEGLEFLNETISEQEKALEEAVDPLAVPSKPTEGGKQATSVGTVDVPPSLQSPR